jgi:uncharacterized protein (TIGR02246 family)
MPARNPEELDALFMQALNSGNIEALMQLYDPQAALRPAPGQSVQGSAAIRQALEGFVAMKLAMSATVKSLGQCGDIALTTAKWKLEGAGPDGKPVQMAGQSVEVSRRQSDGSWRFVIDTPWGLEWES